MFRPADRKALHQVLANTVDIQNGLVSIVQILREMAGPSVRFHYAVGSPKEKESPHASGTHNHQCTKG